MAKKKDGKTTEQKTDKKAQTEAPDAQAAPGEVGAEAGVPPLAVNAQYTKDLSFEVPNAPQIFQEMAEGGEPDIPIGINVSAEQVGDNLFEVALEFSIEAKAGEKVAFILELSFAGLFTVNVPEEHLSPVVLIECPRLLFPFARNIVADVTRDGGFPPVILSPVDFVALYQQKMAEMQAQEGGNPADPGNVGTA